jgi:hypothetical protein
MSFTCTLANTNLNVGDTVSVIVGVTGSLGFESDFTQSSFPGTSDGSTPIGVGQIGGPGLYSVRVISGSDSMILGIMAVPTASGAASLALNNQTESPSDTPDANDVAINNFLGALSAGLNILKNAASAIIGPWATENAAALGADVVVCGVAASGVTAFGVACFDQSVAIVRDLAVSVLIEAAKEMNMSQPQTLSDTDTQLVIGVLTGINTFANLSSAKYDLEFVLEALSALTNAVVENDALKLTLHYGFDEAKKVNLLIEVLKKS